MDSSRAKTRSTRSQTCMKYRGIFIFIKRNSDVNTGDLKKHHKKCQNKVVFQTLSSIYPKWYVFCLQLYARLDSCDLDGSFGTKISGSLIVSPG